MIRTRTNSSCFQYLLFSMYHSAIQRKRRQWADLAIHLTNERRNDDRSHCYTKYYFLSGNAWKITDFPNPFDRFTNMSFFSFESCTLMHLPDLTFQIKHFTNFPQRSVILLFSTRMCDALAGYMRGGSGIL